ncbi:MAG: radical SAM protein [Candidatus Fermentibacteraceae bacterium]
MTPRCNLSCAYCYNVWLESGRPVPSELDTREAMEVLRSLAADPGPEGITFTGGEPMLRDDLTQLASEARGLGMAAAVATNGTLLDKHSARRLTEAGVGHFDIGMSCADSETCEHLGCGDPRRVRDGIVAAAQSGATVTVSLCLTAESCPAAGRTVETAAALGADAVCLNRFVPTGRGADAAEGLSPSPALLRRALREADRASERAAVPLYAGIPLEPCLFDPEDYPHIRFTGCVCGAGKWAVGSDGGLRVCEQSGNVLGSLLRDTFSRLSAGPAVSEFRGRLPREDCPGCPHLEACAGGCRFLPAFATGPNHSRITGN